MASSPLLAGYVAWKDMVTTLDLRCRGSGSECDVLCDGKRSGTRVPTAQVSSSRDALV